jgi:predicted Zn-dependent protease
LGQVASLYDRDFSAAERSFRKALEISPGLASAHQWYSYMLVKQRRFREAIAEAKAAVDNDPLSLPANINLAVQYFYARDDDNTARQSRRVSSLDGRVFFPHLLLAYIFAKKGLASEALHELGQVPADMQNHPLCVRFHVEVHAALGLRTEAQSAIKRLLGERPRGRVPASYIAAAYAAVRDREHAFEWLDQAVAEYDAFASMLDVYPAFDSIRDDSRYAPLLEKLGLRNRKGPGSAPPR